MDASEDGDAPFFTIFQAGTENFVGPGAETFIVNGKAEDGLSKLPARIPTTAKGVTQRAWAWIREQRRPFFIDQLHLVKGWSVIAERKAEEDATAAILGGIPYLEEKVPSPEKKKKEKTKSTDGKEKKDKVEKDKEKKGKADKTVKKEKDKEGSTEKTPKAVKKEEMKKEMKKEKEEGKEGKEKKTQKDKDLEKENKPAKEKKSKEDKTDKADKKAKKSSATSGSKKVGFDQCTHYLAAYTDIGTQDGYTYGCQKAKVAKKDY